MEFDGVLNNHSQRNSSNYNGFQTHRFIYNRKEITLLSLDTLDLDIKY